MKTKKLIVLLILVVGCADKQRSTLTTEHNIPQMEKADSFNNPKEDDKKLMTSHQYGEGIISGQILPADNEQTMAWLDSLQSGDAGTRSFAFKVYKALIPKSDGALSEAICGYIKDYLQSHPEEFIINYHELNRDEKKQTQQFIAFEFYPSDTDYKKELEEYFATIEENCYNCTNANRIILNKLRTEVNNEVQLMLELDPQ